MKTASKGTAFLAAATVALCACSTLPARAQCGKASWYALHSQTASGEMMDPAQMTAAHRDLPFGTKVRVTNKRNGKSIVVRINDRGPFARGRIIDLSKAAASRIGMKRSGHAPVCIVITG